MFRSRAKRRRCAIRTLFCAAVGALAINTGVFADLNFDSIGYAAASVTRALSTITRPARPRYAAPLPAPELVTCFGHVDGGFRVQHNFSATQRGDAAAVVSLASLVELANRDAVPLRAAAAGALYGFLEGGVYHVVLVPGEAHHSAWDDDEAVGAVRDAVAAAVDSHGVQLPTHFSAVPPETVECLGVGDAGAGVAWAVATGAPAVLSIAEVSRMTRMSLRFGTVEPRFLAQITAAAEASTASAAAAEAATGSPALPPLRKHFQACGGERVGRDAAQCDPLPNALHLCAHWLRPVLQYGLCHPAPDYAYGRHDTVAANSPQQPELYSSHRLLEDVAPVTLPAGSVAALAGLVADASFAAPGSPLAYNRLADRAAGWVLVPGDASAGGQVAAEVVVGALLGANITLLGPGRLCNLSYATATAPSDAIAAADGALARGAVAAQAAVASLLASERGGSRGNATVAQLLRALKLAGGAMVAEGASTSLQLQSLVRWADVYAWSLHLADSAAAAGAAGGTSRLPPTSSRAPVAKPPLSDGTTPVAAPPTPTPTLPDSRLPRLAPAPRESLHHCYRDHHNVRDILLVVNFNDWRLGWGTANMRSLVEMHGSSFPGIVAYTSKEMEEVKPNGVPAINLHFCPGGTGNADGLRAQKCTGLALTRYAGHLGYLLINDDAMISPWNMLAYRIDRLWRKPLKGPRFEWYYDCGSEPAEKRQGGWCYNCWSWYDMYGPLTLKAIHNITPTWMIDVKTANLGRSDGVTCSMVDVFYVPGVLAAPFAWLALLTAATGTSVELSQATIWDMVAPRAEQEFMRNVFRGGDGRAEEAYDFRLHDWAHKFPMTRNWTLAIAQQDVAAQRKAGLFYRPNITGLRARLMANDFY